MAYAVWSVTAGEVPTTTKWNILGTNDAGFNDGTAIAAGAIVTATLANNAVGVVRLNYVANTDLANGLAVTGAAVTPVWTDLLPNQNFTVDNANSSILISVSSRTQLGSTASGASVLARAQIDSAGTPINRQIGGNSTFAANQYANPFSGSSLFAITGLAAGVHTLKVQLGIVVASGNGAAYMRAATTSEEMLLATVVELKK